MSGIETPLRKARDSGRKLLVPYVTGGLGRWCEVVEAIVAAGADAVEIGIPFSDPAMDGPVIQEASARALEGGATPASIVAAAKELAVDVPLVAMTYYNVVFRSGHRRFARSLADAGIGAAILPDVPLDEIGEWARAADDAGVDTVLLVAPVTPDDRLARICARSRGFVYGVNLMGVTGERQALGGAAAVLAKRLKACTDLPVLMGLGISTPEQAVEAATAADGVIVGSALVRRLLDGATPEDAAVFVGSLRAALDA